VFDSKEDRLADNRLKFLIDGGNFRSIRVEIGDILTEDAFGRHFLER
jgi:hypothetical protein